VPLSRNLGTLTSWNPLGHSGAVMGLLYLYSYLGLKLGLSGEKSLSVSWPHDEVMDIAVRDVVSDC
jgi:hypothetical protein